MPSAKKQALAGIKKIDVFTAARNLYAELPLQEQRCADLVLNSPELVVNQSITDFALTAKTSEATVLRFSKKLGFSGYPHMRLSMVATIAFDVGWDAKREEELELGITQLDDVETVLDKLANNTINTIRQTVDLCDVATVNELVTAMEEARIIATYGAGASSLVALDCHLKLAHMGKFSICFNDNHHALSSISTLNEGDLLFIVSHSGQTPEAIAVGREFKAHGVKLAVITNEPNSRLAKLADYLLLTQAERKIIRIGATVSRISQLVIVDYVTMSWAQRTWDRSKSASEAASAAVARNNAPNSQEESKELVPKRINVQSKSSQVIKR